MQKGRSLQLFTYTHTYQYLSNIHKIHVPNHQLNGNFRNLNWRYLPYIRPKFQGIYPQFIWPKIWYSSVPPSVGSWRSPIDQPASKIVSLVPPTTPSHQLLPAVGFVAVAVTGGAGFSFRKARGTGRTRHIWGTWRCLGKAYSCWCSWNSSIFCQPKMEISSSQKWRFHGFIWDDSWILLDNSWEFLAWFFGENFMGQPPSWDIFDQPDQGHLSDLSGSAPPKQLPKIGETPSYLNANLASRYLANHWVLNPPSISSISSSATNRTSQDWPDLPGPIFTWKLCKSPSAWSGWVCWVITHQSEFFRSTEDLFPYIHRLLTISLGKKYISLTWRVQPWMGMIPLTFTMISSEVVIKFTQISCPWSLQHPHQRRRQQACYQHA